MYMGSYRNFIYFIYLLRARASVSLEIIYDFALKKHTHKLKTDPKKRQFRQFLFNLVSF
nr:MAG TPA: hypothetical protein [Caudoviricetes sp.]